MALRRAPHSFHLRELTAPAGNCGPTRAAVRALRALDAGRPGRPCDVMSPRSRSHELQADLAARSRTIRLRATVRLQRPWHGSLAIPTAAMARLPGGPESGMLSAPAPAYPRCRFAAVLRPKPRRWVRPVLESAVAEGAVKTPQNSSDPLPRLKQRRAQRASSPLVSADYNASCPARPCCTVPGPHVWGVVARKPARPGAARRPLAWATLASPHGGGDNRRAQFRLRPALRSRRRPRPGAASLSSSGSTTCRQLSHVRVSATTGSPRAAAA